MTLSAVGHFDLSPPTITRVDAQLALQHSVALVLSCSGCRIDVLNFLTLNNVITDLLKK